MYTRQRQQPVPGHTMPSHGLRQVTPVSERAALATILQRAMTAPESLHPRDVVRMQRALGNRAVAEFVDRLSPPRPLIQAKLAVTAPDDQYEREADRVAEQVMRRSSVPRPGLGDEGEASRVVSGRPPASAARGEADEEFEQQLDATLGHGRPLPPAILEEFETAFGADFSGVRIHTDHRSTRLSRAVRAHAFTHGRDVFVDEADYHPGSAAGKRLLAHELTHVLQQGHQAVTPTSTRSHHVAQRLAVRETDWDDVGSARGSEAGASGGVMLLSDKAPDAPGIVLKGMKSASRTAAVVENNPNKTIVSHRVLTEVGGIEVGRSRVIEDDEKTTALSTLATLPKTAQKGSFAERLQFLKNSQRILVMDRFAGRTLRDLALGPINKRAEKEESPEAAEGRIERYRQFVRTFQDPEFLTSLGKMLAVDVFLGNKDRVHAGGLNFGNLMVSDSHAIQAIDSDSKLEQIDKGSLTTADMSGVEAIASGNVADTVASLTDGIKEALGVSEYRLLDDYLGQNSIDIFANFDLVKEGVKTARDIIIRSQQFKAILANQGVSTTQDFDPRQMERRRKYLKYRQRSGAAGAVAKVRGNRKIQ